VESELMSKSPQWIEIHRDNLLQNVAFLRASVAKGTELAAVVKSNAYGHGLTQVTESLRSSVDWFAVHTAEEARQIRQLGIDSRILVMGFVPESELFELDREIHIGISTPETVLGLGNFRRRTGISLPVHIKIETGTNRQGVLVDQIPELCSLVAKEGLDVAGSATHFANIEDTLEHEFARFQLAEFERGIELLGTSIGEKPEYIHAACSAAALLFRETDFTMIRAGISLYGHWPSRETRLAWVLKKRGENGELKPVLAWRALVGQLKLVPKGATVGYGRTWSALRDTKVAVIPIGYADGYPRSVGNRAHVLIAGCRAPVIGRVCMNITMVDVTDIPGVKVGDEVTLIGVQGEQGVSAEELAELAGTINYELLARISPAILRVVV
jgi:alanine racemase